LFSKLVIVDWAWMPISRVGFPLAADCCPPPDAKTIAPKQKRQRAIPTLFNKANRIIESSKIDFSAVTKKFRKINSF
jgi:hypothetical protein